jgi:hypothetical protein
MQTPKALDNEIANVTQCGVGLIHRALLWARPFGTHSAEPQYTECRLLSRWYLPELIFPTLKMEAICSSETSVDTQRTTPCYIPEEGETKFLSSEVG